MKKSDGKIDWKMEEGNAWQSSHTTMPPAAPTVPEDKAIRRKEVALATIIAALLLLIISGAWLWQRQNATAPATNPSTIIPQTTLQETQPLTHTLELLEKSTQVVNIQRLGNRAMAQLTVNYLEEGKTRAYRETHFYQISGKSWQRTAPDPSLLGPAKTLQVSHFTILYRALDADAVYEAVPKLEQLYATLRHDLGLPTIDAGASYTIEVATNRVQGVNNYYFSQRKLTLSAPMLLSAPVEMPPATLLYQEMVYPLARLLLLESFNQHDARWQESFAHWYPIENALALWELWQDGGPLSAEHAEIILWLYKNDQSDSPSQPLPNHYEQLCRTYHIWQFMPLDLSIPLTCSGDDQVDLPASQYPTQASTWRYQSRTLGTTLTPQKGQFSSTITTETMIEYIVATYGRDKLPLLIDALGQHTTTDTLIPALFGVSVADFEAAWQAYLAAHY